MKDDPDGDAGVLPGCSMHTVPGRWAGEDEPFQVWGLDLGHGVFFAPASAAWAPGVCVGGIVWHTHEDGSICGGAITFQHSPNASAEERERPVWNVVSFDPLTLTPSVLDPSCGLHGFVAGGVWVPA